MDFASSTRAAENRTVANSSVLARREENKNRSPKRIIQLDQIFCMIFMNTSPRGGHFAPH